MTITEKKNRIEEIKEELKNDMDMKRRMFLTATLNIYTSDIEKYYGRNHK